MLIKNEILNLVIGFGAAAIISLSFFIMIERIEFGQTILFVIA